MSKTILVADDEMLIALDIQSQLEDLGHQVLIASFVDEAVLLLEHHSIDVAIVDWHMRDEISAPLTNLLKARGIPFVLCSGSALDELASIFPASPILSKPFGSDELLVAVARAVDGSAIQ